MRGRFETRPIASLFLLLYSCANVSVTSPTPVAVPVPVGQKWYGYDGNWSPVSVRVGSPPQWLDVLVSTQNRETWVVGVGGCDGTSICRDKRGGLFRSNASSTWQEVGFYELGLDPQLGFAGYANYGYDNLDLSDQIIVPSQIIGVINTTDHWLGFLGLGLALTNFTNVDKLPFLSSMVENQSLIPSHSYGYTAGAYYRLKHVPASLTLGGYDANRFESHNVSFDLDPNQNAVAAINEITVSARPLSTNYFPLRKAANSSQYTIGRSFLQEAYLIVDYERNNFSVHQATFAIDALTNYDLVNINKPDNSTLTGHSATTGSSLSNGAIAGIVIACVIIVVGLVALLVFCLRKRQNSERDEKQARKKHGLHWFSRKPKEEPLNELLGATHHPVEVPANPKIVELEASTPHELQGSDVVKENVHVSRAPQPRGLTLMLPYDHDPKHPVELHYDNGPRREYYGPEPSPLTPPAYSPSRVGRRENPHATSGEVSRESSPMTTPGLSPSTPMLPISPQAHITPQMGMGGNRHMYRNEGRGIRCTEEGAGDVTVAQPPVSAVGEVRQYQRYSWEDER